MSRTSDIDLAERILIKLPSGSCVRKELEAAYDLGRAAQAEQDAREWDSWHNEDVYAKRLARRFRVRVNRMLEGK